VVVAQYWHVRAGYQLARPQRRDEALATIDRARVGYAVAMAVSGLFLVLALGDVVDTLGLGGLTIVTLIASFVVSVALLTLISTDLLIAALDRARGIAAGSSQLSTELDSQLEAFGRPAPPPPPGPGA
jgi:hypothetical protein